MTESERRYRESPKGRAWKQRSNAQQTVAGRHAEAQARYDRRKAQKRDDARRELICFGADVARQG